MYVVLIIRLYFVATTEQVEYESLGLSVGFYTGLSLYNNRMPYSQMAHIEPVICSNIIYNDDIDQIKQNNAIKELVLYMQVPSGITPDSIVNSEVTNSDNIEHLNNSSYTENPYKSIELDPAVTMLGTEGQNVSRLGSNHVQNKMESVYPISNSLNNNIFCENYDNSIDNITGYQPRESTNQMERCSDSGKIRKFHAHSISVDTSEDFVYASDVDEDEFHDALDTEEDIKQSDDEDGTSATQAILDFIKEQKEFEEDTDYSVHSRPRSTDYLLKLSVPASIADIPQSMPPQKESQGESKSDNDMFDTPDWLSTHSSPEWRVRRKSETDKKAFSPPQDNSKLSVVPGTSHTKRRSSGIPIMKNSSLLHKTGTHKIQGVVCPVCRGKEPWRSDFLTPGTNLSPGPKVGYGSGKAKKFVLRLPLRPRCKDNPITMEGYGDSDNKKAKVTFVNDVGNPVTGSGYKQVKFKPSKCISPKKFILHDPITGKGLKEDTGSVSRSLQYTPRSNGNPVSGTGYGQEKNKVMKKGKLHFFPRNSKGNPISGKDCTDSDSLAMARINLRKSFKSKKGVQNSNPLTGQGCSDTDTKMLQRTKAKNKSQLYKESTKEINKFKSGMRLIRKDSKGNPLTGKGYKEDKRLKNIKTVGKDANPLTGKGYSVEKGNRIRKGSGTFNPLNTPNKSLEVRVIETKAVSTQDPILGTGHKSRDEYKRRMSPRPLERPSMTPTRPHIRILPQKQAGGNPITGDGY